MIPITAPVPFFNSHLYLHSSDCRFCFPDAIGERCGRKKKRAKKLSFEGDKTLSLTSDKSELNVLKAYFWQL